MRAPMAFDRERDMTRTVATLFVRSDSIYKSLPGVDAWDISRDARKWPGGCPVVAHPPSVITDYGRAILTLLAPPDAPAGGKGEG